MMMLSRSIKNVAERVDKALPFESIPGPRPSLPFLGTNWIYFPLFGHYKMTKLHEANFDKYRRYGPIIKEEYQRGYPVVTVFEPSDIKEVFMREGACPSRPVQQYVIKHRRSDPTRYPNVGLANMDGSEWLELRSRLAPLLLSRELKRKHIKAQTRLSSHLVNYISSLLLANTANNMQQQVATSELSKMYDKHSGTVNNVQEVFYRFSMESIMNLCIDRELGCLRVKDTTGCAHQQSSEQPNNSSTTTSNDDGERIFGAAMDFFEAQHKLYYGLGFWKYFDTEPYRQLCDSENSIHDIASKHVDAALVQIKSKRKRYTNENENQFHHLEQEQELNNEEHESLLETLYRTKKFTDLEIKSTIVDFIGGGIYTIANTLTMVLFLLASNPDVQQKLYDEICQVFPVEQNVSHDNRSSDIDIDMDQLDKLKYLKMCLKESYRVLPIIPGVARTLQRDTVLSNYVVPKNTLVFCNFMVACKLPQYFPQPDEYIPSRWERKEADNLSVSNNNNDLAFCMLPFGHGVRKCLGHNFAELEIYVVLINLIRTFKISTLDGQNAKTLGLCSKFIVVPEKPVKLNFKLRTNLTNSRVV